MHVRRESASCPFCGRASNAVPLRRTLAALAGAAAFVSGIGCAYGCPPEGCVGPVDASADRTGDARDLADASVSPLDADVRDVDTSSPVDATTDVIVVDASDASVYAPSDG